MSKAWYVINSYSGYENKAKEQLMERIVNEGQDDYFGRIEVPTQEITEIKGGKEKVCLLYTSPSPRDSNLSRMPSSA